MASGTTVRKDASPHSRKNRWLWIQDVCNDIDLLDFYIRNRTYGPQGTLALISLRDLLKRTIYYLEKGGL